MTVLTAIEIATNYPNGDILVTPIEHKETGKWTSHLYLLRNKEIHKLMLSFDIQEGFDGFDTKEEAISKMDEVIQSVVKYWDEKKK